MDFHNAFILWRGLGVDYEFGVLDHPARAAIHVTHRIGALVTALAILIFAIQLRAHATSKTVLRNIASVILLLLAVQLVLGVLNILLHLPLINAVLHNAVALLLLFSLVSSAYMIGYARN